MDQRLTKPERLSGKKSLDRLFSEGKSFFIAPFRIVVLQDKEETDRPTVRMALSVPRKVFKRAVKRNLIKRRIREAYRRNKTILVEPLREKGVRLDLIFIYTRPEILPYRDIEEKIILSLRKILEDHEKGTH